MNVLALLVTFLLPLLVFWIPAKFKGTGLIAFFIRRTIVVTPYLMWIKLLMPVEHFKLLSISLLMLVTLTLILSEREKYKFKISSTYAAIAGPINRREFICTTYNLVIFVIAEEVFFRMAILTVYPSVWAVFVQSFLFVAGHYLTPWGHNLSSKDLARQLVFSLASGIYFLTSHDLIFCMVSHFILNSHELIHLSRRVLMTRNSELEFI